MPVPINSVLAGLTTLEKQLSDFLAQIPFVPEHDNVWSPSLASHILEAGSQLDSFWKASAPKHTGPLDIRDHFVNFGSHVAQHWIVVWADEPREITPFAAWNASGPWTQSEYRPTAWWQAYNSLKHDRWANIKQATLSNALNIAAGLFLAIARSAVCLDSLVARNWIRAHFEMKYTISEVANGAERAELGITVESTLFSYAYAALNSQEFERCLICYGQCSHRFGRWLEAKYKRAILL